MSGETALRRVVTRRSHVVAVIRETEAGFRHNDLLTYASAIAFQMILALAPFLLLLIGLLGFFHLDSVWSTDIAPDVKPNVSPAAFSVIDDTVRNVLGSQRLFWVTGGLALAVWEISGAVRAVMGALDGIYGVEHERSLKEKLLPSLWLSAAVGVLLVAAASVIRFGPILLGDSVPSALAPLLFVVRWGVGAAILAVAVGLLVRHCPRSHQPLPWVSVWHRPGHRRVDGHVDRIRHLPARDRLLRLGLRPARDLLRDRGLSVLLGGRLPRGSAGGRGHTRSGERAPRHLKATAPTARALNPSRGALRNPGPTTNPRDTPHEAIPTPRGA